MRNTVQKRFGLAGPAAVAAVFFLLCAGNAPGQPAGDLVESISLSDISARDGRLWVDVREYPADELFSEIGRAAGFEVLIDKSYAEQDITVRFNGVPLERAISRLVRLLNTKNFRLAYGEDGSVNRLEIFKANLAGTGAGAMAAGPGGAQPRVERREPRSGSPQEAARARVPVRRRVAAAPEEFFEEDQQWNGEEFADEQFWEEDQQLLEAPEAQEDLPYLEPVGEVQRFR